MHHATLTKRLRMTSIRWHKHAAWFGAFTLLLWGVSGISHPLMSWLGPKAEKFYPPSFVLAVSEAEKVSLLVREQIRSGGLDQARVIKLVASRQGPQLQITEAADRPRRYLPLTEKPLAVTPQSSDSNASESYSDEQQARWLASYYTGRDIKEITSVEFQTHFSADYPWVNRLLPIYRVRFSGADELTAYLHTETNALAGLNNRTKQSLQTLFQALHTWNWLGNSELSRVLVITLLMVSLLTMALTGLVMVLTFRSRKILSPARRWHRWLAYAVWLPLLGWSASGFYHLLQSSYITTPSETLTLPNSYLLASLHQETLQNLPPINPALLAGQRLNSLALVSSAQGVQYRLSVSPAHQDGEVSHEARFKGKPQEQRALYIDLASGQASGLQDQQLAGEMALRFSRFEAEQIVAITPVTHFGPGYDFRNKRLPVWQVDFNDEQGSRLFVDTRSGVLVDSNRALDRAERWSFSILHKWSHLTGIMGRFNRDLLIVTCLLLSLLAGTLGTAMQLKRRKTLQVRNRLEKSAAGCCSPDA